MKAQLNFSQDSVSCMVDDRFFESESSAENNPIEQELSPDAQHKEEMNQTVVPLQSQENMSQFGKKYSQRLMNLSYIDSILGNDSQHKQPQRCKRIQSEKKQGKSGKGRKLLQKKKQNSKNYRQRKKQFISKLQQQNNYYKRKSAQLQEKVRLLEAQICQLKYDESPQKSGYQKQYQRDIEFLRTLIYEQKVPNSEVGKVGMKMREKYGPAGHDRKMILNYYMSEYINSTMADFQKYIFSSVLKKTGIFGDIKSKFDEKMEQLLNLNQNERYQLRTTVLNQLYPAAIGFSNCCKNIYKHYVALLDQAKTFHDKMSKGLNYDVVPELARMVVWFDQNKNNLEVRKVKQEWIKLFSGQFQNQTTPKI